MTNINDILNERQKTHGDYVSVSEIYSEIKSSLANGVHNNVDARFETALDMIAMKMARIVCGNPNEIQHWEDIAGYATLVMMELKKCTL